MQIWHSVHRERLILNIIFTVKGISWTTVSFIYKGLLSGGWSIDRPHLHVNEIVT